MEDDKQVDQSSAQWGKLTKNIIAGAAIVAGLLIVFPGLGESLSAGVKSIADSFTQAGKGAVDGLKSSGASLPTPAVPTATPEWITAMGEKLAPVKDFFAPAGQSLSWTGEHIGAWWSSVTGGSTWMSDGIGVLLAKAVGVIAVITGVHMLGNGQNNEKPIERAPQEPAPSREEDESFAAREDMRKMQTVMLSRMQAQGYPPAMAMAGQQVR